MSSLMLRHAAMTLVAFSCLILTGMDSPTVTPTAPALRPLMAMVGPVIAQPPPPTAAFCLATFGIACYGPSDMRNQYDLNPLYAEGVTGAGQTIVIFDSYGSPTIQSDLHTFDVAYGLPDPPSFKVISPEGTPKLNYDKVGSPADFHNKNIGTQIGWAYETTLDVEWAHAIAPGANILLVTTPVAETEGVQGLQNILNASSTCSLTIWGTSSRKALLRPSRRSKGTATRQCSAVRQGLPAGGGARRLGLRRFWRWGCGKHR